MASAVAPSFRSTKETTNYARLCRLQVDVGAHILRETFDKRRPTGDLHTVLSSPPVHAVLKLLRKKRILNPLQWGKLYPAIKSAVSSKNFDITLLMVLLRNICGLVRPATGWDTLPLAADTTLEADIVRIKCYRNTVYGHASEASVDDATFNKYWQDIQDALVRLGGAGYQSAIDDLKMNPWTLRSKNTTKSFLNSASWMKSASKKDWMKLVKAWMREQEAKVLCINGKICATAF